MNVEALEGQLEDWVAVGGCLDVINDLRIHLELHLGDLEHELDCVLLGLVEDLVGVVLVLRICFDFLHVIDEPLSDGSHLILIVLMVAHLLLLFCLPLLRRRFIVLAPLEEPEEP